MQLTTEKAYNATPAELWQIIHDPGTMPAWNPKCVVSQSLDPWKVGQQFAITYEMNGKVMDALGELINFESERMVHFRYTYEYASKVGTIDEILQILPSGANRTLLKQTVDFSQSTLPRWVKWLIGFLNRFGKTKGKGPLDGIEALLN